MTSTTTDSPDSRPLTRLRARASSRCTSLTIRRASASRLSAWPTITGLSGGPIEQLEAELSFQVGDCLGDHRLSPPEPARGSGETAFVHGGHKSAELAQRH